MSEHNERLADIVAQKRGNAWLVAHGYEPERTTVNGNGNVAALCEALELCKHELCEMCRRHNPGETCVNGCETIIRAKTALAANHQSAPVGNAAAMREALAGLIDGICFHCDLSGDCKGAPCEKMQNAKAALAKPPRNCDKYANHNDAMRAFDAFVREEGKLGFINPYTESFKWLFAPATEQKGETDGSK